MKMCSSEAVVVSAVCAKAAAKPLGPETEQEHQRDNDTAFKQGECPGISKMIPDHVLDGYSRRCQQYAQLIDKTWEETPHRIRRQFTEMSRDYSEGTLHAGLHEERANEQSNNRMPEGPRR